MNETTRQELMAWVIERWEAEVKNRPMVNFHRRTLDGTWRQVYRKISGGKELPRPTHDEVMQKLWGDEQ